jgi:ankyrin repeat protein
VNHFDALPREILAYLASFVVSNDHEYVDPNLPAFVSVSQRFCTAACTAFGWCSVFACACGEGFEEVVWWMLSFDISHRADRRGGHPLDFGICRSSENGRAGVVRLLLCDGSIDPSIFCNYAIAASSANGHIDVVRLLLADARVDPVAYGGQFHGPIQHGDWIEHVVFHDNYAILKSSENGHAAVVQLLLKDGRVDPTTIHNAPLYAAMRSGNADVVRLLLADARVEPGNTFINDAIIDNSERGRADMVRLLLADGRGDPSSQHNLALCRSVGRGHVDVVRLLLADGRSDPAAHNNAAIKMSCEQGHADVVRVLLEDGRVNPCAWGYETSDNNNAPIRLSSAKGHADVVRLLLRISRVDPTVRNNEAVRAAKQNGHAAVVSLLLADPRVARSLKNSQEKLMSPDF